MLTLLTMKLFTNVREQLRSPSSKRLPKSMKWENTKLKKLRFLALGAALALPQVAHGKLGLPNEIFGRIEANLDVCSKVNSKSAARYQEAKKTLTQGVTDDEVKAARESQEYKDSYSSTKQELEKKSKEELAKVCAAALDQSK